MTEHEKIKFYEEHISDELHDAEKYWYTYHATGKEKHLTMAKEELSHAMAFEEEARMLLAEMETNLSFLYYDKTKELQYLFYKVAKLHSQIYA